LYLLFLVGWFYLLLFPNFFIPLVVKNGVPGCSSEKFHLDVCQSFLSFFSKDPNCACVEKTGGKPVHYMPLFLNIFGPEFVEESCLELSFEHILLVGDGT
jgi:hypothetical protein